ncbi:MAG: AbiH family protein [Oscillospiraceae bacterium]
MKKNTLFIIGNGFDMFHGLPTHTSNFCEILSSKRVDGDIDNALEIFLNYGVDWGEYENSLGKMNLDEIEEQNLTMPDYLSDHESDRDGTIFNMESYLSDLSFVIEENLSEMVENANELLYDTEAKLNNVFMENDAILSFNYTSTLEELYEIEGIPILHIHGYFEDNDGLLFGYREGKNADEYRKYHFDPLDDSRDYYVDSQREKIVMFYENWRKNIQLNKLKEFLNNIHNIDRICVMGHSMSYVDGEYMELIEEILSPSKWYISQHNNSPSKEALGYYSFANKVVFYSLNDLTKPHVRI